MKINSHKPGISSYLFPSIIILCVIFVQGDTFVTKHCSLVAEVNSIHIMLSFLTVQDRFQIFLFQRTIVSMKLFLLLGCSKQVSNSYDRFIGNFENVFDGGSVVIRQIARLYFVQNGWYGFRLTQHWFHRRGSLYVVIQSTQLFSFGFWFLVFSRKECFSNKILEEFNSVLNNLFQQVDNRFEVSFQCDIHTLLYFTSFRKRGTFCESNSFLQSL